MDKNYSLAQIAEHLGARLEGDGSQVVHSISTLANAGKGQISFLANSKYRSQLAATQASAVLLAPADLDTCQTNAIVLDNPYVGYAKLAQLMDTTPKASTAVAPTAVIAEDVQLGIGVTIGPNAVVSPGATIGDGCDIGANSFIGENCSIGANSKVWANATLYHSVQVGENCLVHSGAVIGADGFGFANDAGQWVKIPQLGRVIIGDNCEVGANTTIDRGALGDTTIGDNVILDNQIQIAHNVELGDGVAMAACTVIAGSTRVGKGCTIAGAVGINGHLEIVDNVHITGMSMVTKSIKEAGVYSSGMPIMDNKTWRKTMVRFKQLDELNQRFKALEAAVQTAQQDNSEE